MRRAIARLQHPNIWAVFDVGEEGGVDYLVMEYLEGETLEKQLERGPLPVSEALRIGAQIAPGLDAAHRAGITHRDLIKPGNVMLTKSGAKLLDFGLAKLSHTAPVATDGSTVVTMTKALTVEGTIIGTFQYMAPEQPEGEEADTATDVFAFGLVLYEMGHGAKSLSGEEPGDAHLRQRLQRSAFDHRRPACDAARTRTRHTTLSRQGSRRALADRPRSLPGTRVDCKRRVAGRSAGSSRQAPRPASSVGGCRRRAGCRRGDVVALRAKAAADLPLVQFRVSLPA